jgi:hypothetical protein
MTRGWAEKQRLGDLSAYAKAEGSDIEQFANFDEEAKLLLDHSETAKVRPGANSRWFAQAAANIRMQIADAEIHIGTHRNKEFDSTITDLKMLANLAIFHSRRIPAAVNYRLFERTRDPRSLEDAIHYERSAVEAWRELVAAAGDFYADDLMMGVRGASLCGHWKDELTLLEKGLVALETQRRDLKPGGQSKNAPRYRPTTTTNDSGLPLVAHQRVTTSRADKPLTITAEVHDPEGVEWVRLRYRSVNQHQDYRALPMLPTGEKDQYRAVIPAEHILSRWDVMYFIEAMGRKGNGTIYPDLDKETPYVVVKLQR